jgi:serine/threonine protein kinase
MSIKPGQKKEVVSPATEMSKTQSFTGIALESVSRMFCPKCEQKINTSSVKALSEGRCPSCGEKIIVQGKVGPYRVLKLIGQGGMGAVYEGFDDGLGRKVAIKVTLMDVTRDRNMMETFQREAQVVAKLNHPNIVQVYAFGEENGHPYLVMELLPAGSLLERIEVEDPIDSAFLMGVAMEVSEGLNAAQEAGLLHGDIKPENILFDDKMHAKLVDFGLAAISSSATKNEVWGTPFYIAPEKVTERKSNHKCDIYSLGATLYHAFTKRPPFDGLDGTAVVKACIEEQAKPLSEKRPDIEPEVEAIISRMMEKDVSRRYPNYKSIIADIKKFLTTVPAARLSRTSRIVTHGLKKTAGTKKILLQLSISR